MARMKIKIKRMAALVLALAMTAGLAGCAAGAKEDAQESEEAFAGSSQETAGTEEEKEKTEEPEPSGQAGGAQDAAGQEEGPLQVKIYYSNEMADGLEVTTVEMENITPELLISNLATYNIVPKDTRVNRSETVTEQEFTILLLDLSAEFGNYVSTMGTSGEYVIMGALTNTFLDAYGADRLRLTVEGNVLETGHSVYDYDMERSRMTSYGIQAVEEKEGNISLTYPELYSMRDTIVQDEWNQIFAEYARKNTEGLSEGASLTLTYEVATSTEELLSIVYRAEVYEPEAAHPYRYIETFNVDMMNGQMIRLTDYISAAEVVECLTQTKDFTVLGGEAAKEDVEGYLDMSPEALTEEYFSNFDWNSMDPSAVPFGYSYKKDGQVVVCLEVPHALGDFIELQIS